MGSSNYLRSVGIALTLAGINFCMFVCGQEPGCTQVSKLI